jgi:serine/threonine protein kinase
MSTPKIGHYELQREIGRGGMAVVYLARDPDHNRAVAIKMLPNEFMYDPKFIARFKRETKVIMRLLNIMTTASWIREITSTEPHKGSACLFCCRC